MNTTKIDFEFNHITNNPLHIEIIVDDQKYTLDHPTSKSIALLIDYNDTEATQHALKLYVSGKRDLIESMDDVNAAVEITGVSFNGLDVLPMLTGATYSHNFNGYGEKVVEEFTTFLGCDGVLEFEFYLPVSYWVAKCYPY
jgi:hypothetical protein